MLRKAIIWSFFSLLVFICGVIVGFDLKEARASQQATKGLRDLRDLNSRLAVSMTKTAAQRDRFAEVYFKCLTEVKDGK